MNNFLIYILLSIPLIGYTQWDQNPIITYNGIDYILHEYHDSTYWYHSEIYYAKYDSLSNYLGKSKNWPKDGKWIKFYMQDSSKVASIFNVKNNKLNGLYQIFRFDGSLERQENFKDNNWDGYIVKWHENGQISSIIFMKSVDYGHFFRSEHHGPWHSWYSNGQFRSTEEYDNFHLKGESLKYHLNGQLKEKAFYNEIKREQFEKEGKKLIVNVDYYHLTDPNL